MFGWKCRSNGCLPACPNDCSWPMLLKKSLHGVAAPQAKISTSQIGLQASREPWLGVKRPMKTSRNNSAPTFLTASAALSPTTTGPARTRDGHCERICFHPGIQLTAPHSACHVERHRQGVILVVTYHQRQSLKLRRQPQATLMQPITNGSCRYRSAHPSSQRLASASEFKVK